MLETQKAKKKLYDKLKEIVQSGYGSTIARISLLDAAKKVRRYGFSFKICQIPNQDKETDSSLESSFLIVDTLEREGKRKYLPDDTIETPDGRYILINTQHEDCNLLHALLGVDINQQLVYTSSTEEPLRKIFSNDLEKWIYEKDNAQAFQKAMLQLVFAPIKNGLNSRSRNHFIKALVKDEIPIKEWLEQKGKLDEKIKKEKEVLLENCVKYMNQVLSSLDKSKFVQEMYGRDLSVSEGVKKTKELLKGPKENVLEILLQKNQWQERLIKEKDQNQITKQKKEDEALPFKKAFKNYVSLILTN